MSRFIGIEAGGTKFVCAMRNVNGELIDRLVIPTETPDITLRKVMDYIAKHNQQEKIDAIGIACFGPIDLDEASPFYGYITTTPKISWQHCDIVGKIQNEFDVPIGFDTDVNAAALAEHRFGAAKHVDHFIYITVGTGIGAGAMINGKLLHGALHPEMGHIFIPQNREEDSFEGMCSYHDNCLEGLASGPAMMSRWSVESALDLPTEHKAWDLEAHYLALACMNYTLTLSPKKIILGGGVMKETSLFEKIRSKLPILLNHYINHLNVAKMENYIVPAALTENAGIIGAIALAEQSYQKIKYVEFQKREITA